MRDGLLSMGSGNAMCIYPLHPFASIKTIRDCFLWWIARRLPFASSSCGQTLSEIKNDFFLCTLVVAVFYNALCSYVSSDGRRLFCCSFPLMKWLFYWITGRIWNDKRYSDTFLYLLIEYLCNFLCRRLKSIIFQIYLSSSFIFSVPLTIAPINSFESSVPLSTQINI